MRTSIRSLSNVQRVTAAVTASVFAFATLTALPPARTRTHLAEREGHHRRAARRGARRDRRGHRGVHSGVAYAVGGNPRAGAGASADTSSSRTRPTGGPPCTCCHRRRDDHSGPRPVAERDAVHADRGATEDHAPRTRPPPTRSTRCDLRRSGRPAPLAPPLPSGGATPPATVPTPRRPPCRRPPQPRPGAASEDGQGRDRAPSLAVRRERRRDAPRHSRAEVRQTFSASELRQYGVAQQTEVRMPIVKIAF